MLHLKDWEDKNVHTGGMRREEKEKKPLENQKLHLKASL